MMATFDPEESQILRETLQSALNQLRNEIAHADNRAFRAGLQARERVVERVIAKLVEENRTYVG